MRLFRCDGGEIVLPPLVLTGRLDGGNLIVNPPREVWERSELTAAELTHWSFLVAATGRAMLDVLPQLDGGCINYWEAGNWALHDDAEPRGRKSARDYRRVHLHLLGRSRSASSPTWRWGEAPLFPAYADRLAWAASFEPLTAEECGAIVTRAQTLLTSRYGMQVAAPVQCARCGYPHAEEGDCEE